MRVLCVGDVNQDIITPQISYFPLRNEQLIVKNFRWFVGGGAALTACALSSLGLDTTLVGCVGDDSMGKELIVKIKGFGVKSKVKKVESSTEVTFAVSFANAARSFISTVGANNQLTVKDLPLLEGFDHLHVSGFYHLNGLNKSIGSLLKRAKNAGLSTSFDPGFSKGSSPARVKELLPLVDVLFVSDPELKSFGGIQFCSRRVSVLAVHSGIDGSVAYHKGQRYLSEPIRTKIVNSTGSGAVYNAGFLKNYLRGRSVQECINKGLDVAKYYMRREKQEFPKR